MKLTELAREYRSSAALLRDRLRQLRQEEKETTDPEKLFWIRRRTAELTPMLRQTRELAELMEHYYERGYWRDEKYRL